jgi:hypothetical protein
VVIVLRLEAEGTRKSSDRLEEKTLRMGSLLEDGDVVVLTSLSLSLAVVR